MGLGIESVRAVEILDSRARPILAVRLSVVGGSTVWAGVPSGVSTWTREAVELRDGDPARYGGTGVLRVVGHVNGAVSRPPVAYRCGVTSPRPGQRLGCPCRISTWSTAGRTPPTRWTSKSS